MKLVSGRILPAFLADEQQKFEYIIAVQGWFGEMNTELMCHRYVLSAARFGAHGSQSEKY